MAKTKSKAATAAAAIYKLNRRWESNRKRRLERTIRNQPNNEQAKLALKNISYRRKTPVTREWSASWIAFARLFKFCTGRFDRDIMSSNPETSRKALLAQSPAAMHAKTKQGTRATAGIFSLENRANIRQVK